MALLKVNFIRGYVYCNDKAFYMKNILLPTDFSEASRKAGEYAASMAKTFNAGLQLLHVYMEPAAIGEVPAVWLLAEAQLLEDNKWQIEKEATYLGKKYRVNTTCNIKNGFKSHEIANTAEQKHADIIVMSIANEKNRWIDGTTISTIRKTKVPIIVVPEGAGFKPIKNITLATDFNDKTDFSCFKVLIDIVQKFNAEIQVLNVQKKDALIKPSELAGKIKLERILSNIKHTYYTEESETVQDGITSFIDQHPTDLLAMVAHRHNVFEHLFGTIHTKAMSYQTKVPLLVLEDV